MKLTTLSVYEETKKRFLELKLKEQLKEGRQISNAQFFEMILNFYMKKGVKK
jgi:hypothetical protein